MHDAIIYGTNVTKSYEYIITIYYYVDGWIVKYIKNNIPFLLPINIADITSEIKWKYIFY